MVEEKNDWAMELRRVKDASGNSYYIFTNDDGGFVSDVHALDANLEELVGVTGKVADTITNMAVEGYIVRYYPLEKKVVAEVTFTEEK